MSLLIGLPLAAYGLLFLIAGPGSAGRRAAALHAAVLWAVTVLAITETLSLFRALAVPGLAGAWMLADLAAAAYLWRRAAPIESLRALCRDALFRFDPMEIALLLGILFLLAGVGVAALVSPPNTTDAMVYHMPRIVHWLHNRSVSFYATQELRQLKMPPWAEYSMLQFHGLSGGDRFDNLVQWFSLAGSIAGVSLIAGLLGAGVRGQVFAAFLCATIPQGLLEASGAKNDCVAALWLVALVYYLLRFRQDPTARNVWGIGGALGLACLTKTVAFVLAPPLVLSLALLQAPGRARGKYIPRVALAALLALALNAPHFARNYSLFHTPLGPSAEAPPAGFKYTNDRLGPAQTLSNVLRNLALHATTPLASLNRAMEAGIIRVLGIAGESANDPATTWDRTEFHVPPLNFHEATAGNPVHAALILLVCGFLFWRWRARETRAVLLLSIGLLASFLLFCAVFKWQPWHTRLHLPLFVLGAAVAGAVLSRYWSRAATAVLGMLMLLYAIPEAFANPLRPLIGRVGWNIFSRPRRDLYFADLRDRMAPYQAAAKFVESSQCQDIGLDLSQEPLEYPLLALLNDLRGDRPIRNVYVTNESRVYDAATERRAACVICPNCALRRPGWEALARQFGAVNQFGGVLVLSGPPSPIAAANACTVEFSGWYGLEKTGADWWRWSTGQRHGTREGRPTLRPPWKPWCSPPGIPNEVRVVVNGEQEALLHETSPETSFLTGVAVELRQGDNLLEFRSENAPVQLAGDPRPLALSLKNLAFRTGSSTGCAVDPN